MAKQTCKHCGTEFGSYYSYDKHMIAAHPEVERRTYTRAVKQQSAHDVVLDHINGIKNALKQLEHERDALSQKVLQYDDLIAKYKKLI